MNSIEGALRQMKPSASLLLGICLLAACQARPAGTPLNQQAQQASQNLRQQAAVTAAATDVNPLRLPLSAGLLSELRQPDDEAEPREQTTVSDEQIEKVLGTRYVHAHSFYFDHLDTNGKSTVETILEHDGKVKAAGLIKQWRKTLAEGSVWPDRNSTTYKGRFTALEHGQVSDTKGWLMFRNASTKAEEYYQLAKKAYKRDLPPDHPNQTEAWAWIGRTSHFVQDLTVPFHTKSFIRPAQVLFHHPYELSSERLFERYFPSRNHNPFSVWAQGGPYPATGNWGHYYAPGTSADSMIKQLAAQSRPFYGMVNELENSKSGNWEKSRAVMIPLGAKATSGLIVAFLGEMGVQP